MRVGFYIGEIHKETIGGGHTFQMSVIEKLMQMQSNHEFYFYYKSPKNLFKNNENATFINIFERKKFKYSLGSIIRKLTKSPSRLNKRIAKDKIEFVYFYTPIYEPVNVPFAITVWDLGHRKEPCFPELSTEKSTFIEREKYHSTVLMRASYAVIGNNEGKRQLQYFYNIAEERIKTIPMPTPDYVYNIEEDFSTLQRYGLDKNKYLFYPAQFWAHKNHIRLIKALKKLKEQGSDFKLVFTGSDFGNKEYIKEKTKELGLENEVLFLGFVKKEELIALYKNAYALTYASFLGPDNIPPLEAMALECPVISSDAAGMKEQLKDCALFFNPKDENDLVKRINELENAELRQTLIEKGRILAKNDRIDNYVEKIVEIIDDFLPIRECWGFPKK